MLPIGIPQERVFLYIVQPGYLSHKVRLCLVEPRKSSLMRIRRNKAEMPWLRHLKSIFELDIENHGHLAIDTGWEWAVDLLQCCTDTEGPVSEWGESADPNKAWSAEHIVHGLGEDLLDQSEDGALTNQWAYRKDLPSTVTLINPLLLCRSLVSKFTLEKR